MRVSDLRIFGITLATAAALAGCGGSASLTPPDAATLSGPARPDGRSWMAAGQTNQDLLYVSNKNGVVNVYRYWQHKLVGVLTNFTQPAGACADKAGNVYIVDYLGKTVSEYAHGGTKPMRVISDSYMPFACSVDRTTGNLAVANYGQAYDLNDPAYKGGNLAVYLHAKGKPTYYGSSDDHFSACAYDDRGDLFASTVSTYSSSYYYYGAFDYLPKNSKTILSIDVPPPSSSSDWGLINGVAYDGKYWVVDDYKLYRYTINIKAVYVDSIALSGGSGAGGIVLYRKTLKSPTTQVVGAIGYNTSTTDIGYWKYPGGGSPYYKITTNLDAPDGVAISLKQ